jgi:uncharacterized protein YkwD
MKMPIAAIALGIAAMGASISCGPAYNLDASHANSNPQETALANAMFQSVEAYRASRSCGVLQRHPGLDGLARQHSQFLRANRGKFALHGSDVGHFGFDQRILAADRLYHIKSIGENVATASSQGSSTADAIVKLWINSPPHDHNLRNSWVTTGIGVVIDEDGKAFVTQIFGTHANTSPREGLDRFKQH